MHYIKRYPLSILIILTVIYLSFFKPPSTDLSLISNLDKVAHICMYMGLSGMLWFEFIRAHRTDNAPLWHAWIGAFLCPIVFSGAIEVMQGHLTSYRGGEWMDFVANVTGTVIATLIGCFVLRPAMKRRG